MRRPALLFATFMSFLFIGCLSGKPMKEIPKHLRAGDREIKKGMESYRKGCYSRSLEHLFRAYELYSASDLLDGVAMSLNNIGTTYREIGEYDEAVLFFEEAYTTYLQLNDEDGALQALSNKASALISSGKLDMAGQTIKQAREMLPEYGNRKLLISVLRNKGVLLTRKGLYEEAEEVLSSCLGRVAGLDPAGRASIYFAYGNLMIETDRPAKAVSFFEKALSLDRELGFYEGIADDLFSIGLAYSKLGRDEKAVQYWKRGIKIFALIDKADRVGETMGHLKKAAGKAGIDILVTEAFVERWRQGVLYESPCKD